jgi:hypothetical protein
VYALDLHCLGFTEDVGLYIQGTNQRQSIRIRAHSMEYCSEREEDSDGAPSVLLGRTGTKKSCVSPSASVSEPSSTPRTTPTPAMHARLSQTDSAPSPAEALTDIRRLDLANETDDTPLSAYVTVRRRGRAAEWTREQSHTMRFLPFVTARSSRRRAVVHSLSSGDLRVETAEPPTAVATVSAAVSRSVDPLLTPLLACPELSASSLTKLMCTAYVAASAFSEP